LLPKSASVPPTATLLNLVSAVRTTPFTADLRAAVDKSYTADPFLENLISIVPSQHPSLP